MLSNLFTCYSFNSICITKLKQKKDQKDFFSTNTNYSLEKSSLKQQQTNNKQHTRKKAYLINLKWEML